jgi:hypothetical protein
MNLPTLAQREQRYIRRVISLCGGDVAEAAAVLGIGRSTCYRKVAELGLQGELERLSKLRPLCPMCRGPASRFARDEEGRLTWCCRQGCNP